jgi:hypothetical protein
MRTDPFRRAPEEETLPKKTPKHNQISTDKILQPASRRLYGDPRPLNNAFTVLPALSPSLLTGYWIL